METVKSTDPVFRRENSAPSCSLPAAGDVMACLSLEPGGTKSPGPKTLTDRSQTTMRRVLALSLMVALLLPEVLPGQQQTVRTAQPRQVAAAAAPASPEASAQSQNPSSARPQAQRSRSYERETGRRRSGISKKEWIFLGAIAGTSMGIGALAAGAKGLAIGSIVGGWGAFVGHKIWRAVS